MNISFLAQTFPGEIISCPAACSQQVYVELYLWGLAIGILGFLLFHFTNNLSKKVRTILLVFSLILSLLLTVRLDIDLCGSGCDADGIYLQTVEILPKFLNIGY